jgi:thioesterase domain-containing protein
LAYATALVLERSGGHVNKVGLLDTYEGTGLLDANPNSRGDPFANIGYRKGIVGPIAAWLAAKALKRNLVRLSGGDPRMRLLFGIRSLPLGAMLIRTAGHLAPLFVSTRANAALNREIRKGRFHEMWFDWVKTINREKPLQAPVILFRSEEPGLSDRGWGGHNLNLTIVSVAGNHQTMLATEHIDDLIAKFANVMVE